MLLPTYYNPLRTHDHPYIKQFSLVTFSLNWNHFQPGFIAQPEGCNRTHKSSSTWLQLNFSVKIVRPGNFSQNFMATLQANFPELPRNLSTICIKLQTLFPNFFLAQACITYVTHLYKHLVDIVRIGHNRIIVHCFISFIICSSRRLLPSQDSCNKHLLAHVFI